MPDTNNRLSIYEQLVRKEFGFLEREYDFQISNVTCAGEHIRIQYQSSNVYVSLWYGPPDFGLECSFGRIGIEDQNGEHSLCLGDLLYLEGTDDWSDFTSFYLACELDNLRKWLPKLVPLAISYDTGQ